VIHPAPIIGPVYFSCGVERLKSAGEYPYHKAIHRGDGRTSGADGQRMRIAGTRAPPPIRGISISR
jgi:hypothetical protein